MDSEVQGPPGQPPPDAGEIRGLRALFRKDRPEPVPTVEDDDPYLDDSYDLADGDEPLESLDLADDTYTADDTYADDTYTADEAYTADDAYLAADPEVPADADENPGPSGAAGLEPEARAAQRRARGRPARQPPSHPVTSRTLISPRLRADPRLRVWVTRTIMCGLVYLGFLLWHGWRIGVTAAVVYTAADTVYRSKTTAIVPPAARVTAAQRSTRRRLKVLQPAGYLALNARRIPGTSSVVDHLVVGPAGIFTIDSQRFDRRLPLHALGGMLYHGPVSMDKRLAHAREEAKQTATLVSAELGRKVRTRPAMVVYGPGIPWVIMTLAGVDVFDGSRVGTYFRRQSKATRGRHLDASQIAEIYAAAARALPPV